MDSSAEPIEISNALLIAGNHGCGELAISLQCVLPPPRAMTNLMTVSGPPELPNKPRPPVSGSENCPSQRGVDDIRGQSQEREIFDAIHR